MSTGTSRHYLGQISTRWLLVEEAHRGEENDARAARGQLAIRYRLAAYRYLLRVVGCPDVAEELAQEFAIRCLRGKFHGAHPDKGRFRDYLAQALKNLVHDHYRARQSQLKTTTLEPATPDEATLSPATDRVGQDRGQLLANAWRRLEQDHPSYAAVLRIRMDDPGLSSAEMAQRLTQSRQKETRADWVRKTQQRAQMRFAEFILDEAIATSPATEPLDLASHLRRLGLYHCCHAALARRNVGRAARLPENESHRRTPKAICLQT